jgi:MFS family permease
MSSRPVIAGFGALGLFWGAWASLLPSVQRATGASKAELGVALLCVAIGSVPATLLAGWLIDHFGSVVVPVSICAFGAAVVLPGLARSVPVLALTLVVAGATSGAMDVAVNARVAAIEVEPACAACISRTPSTRRESSSARSPPGSRAKPAPGASRSCSASPRRSW